ncbi:MAG: isopentenyl-diphosphate Delta-isomerase [Fuerstiella sp.]
MTPPASQHVVLCDSTGRATGTAERQRAHTEPGMLHQAFSVFVFRNEGREVLIQQRSAEKTLFALRWANTCCSHTSDASDNLIQSAETRLQQEFGFSAVLTAVGSFVYSARDEGKGVEHEHDTVLTGHVANSVQPDPDPAEIADWKWVETTELARDLEQRPETFAPWLKPAFEIALKSL